MINLLPDQRKIDIRAARANVIILRYMAIIVLALAFLGGALYLSYSLLQATMTSSEEIIASNDVKASVYDSTREEVSELSAQLSETKTILDQEIRYSKVLVELGRLMPAGTVLNELNIDTSSVAGTPIEVTAYAKSVTEASAIQTQFQSSQLFSQVSISSTEESGGTEEYPVKIILSVTLNRTGLQQ